MDFLIEDGELKGYSGEGGDIVIPDTVTVIKDRAFGDCNSITGVTIPSSVIHVGECAFINCIELKKAVIAGSVKTVSRGMFLWCPLESVVLEEGVECIENDAFLGNALNELQLPKSLKVIGDSSLGDSALSTLFVADGLSRTEYDNATYMGVTDNPYCFLLEANNRDIESCNIHPSCRFIYDYAFNECTSLRSVTIPEGVTTICQYAFHGCTSLNDAVIPKSCVKIGKMAFKDCPFIERKSCAPSRPDPLIYPPCKDDSDILESGDCGLGDYSLPYKVYRSGEEIVLHIKGDGEMRGYNHVPYYFSGHAPWYKFNITAAYIDEGVRKIGSEAFKDCKNLKSLFIPQSVSKWGWGGDVLKGCSALSRIDVADVASFCQIGTNYAGEYFNPSDLNYDLYCGGKLVEEIVFDKNDTMHWNRKEDVFGTIGGCKSIKKISIDGNITLCESAFENCFSLCEVTLPANLGKIPSGSFKKCASLQSVTLPDSLETIESYAFCNCSSLKEIDLPSCLLTIASDAFDGCTSLESINIPASATFVFDIYDYYCCFSGCNSLSTITVDSENPHYYSESNCLIRKSNGVLIKAGSTDTVPEGIKIIGNDAFSERKELKNIVIPDSVDKISSHAFEGCTNLETVHMGKNIKSIGNDAFGNCTSLKNVYWKGEIISYPSNAFKNCPEIKHILSDESTLTEADILLKNYDKLCKKECDPKKRKLCALLRSSDNKWGFSVCSHSSLSLINKGGKRYLRLFMITNEGNVWPDSSMPYREWDELEYTCLIPSEVSDEDAYDYACSNLPKWKSTATTETSSI